MNNTLNLCFTIDGNSIYRFSGKMNEQNMIESANSIERLLTKRSVPLEKVQNVFELFVETIQNILSYAANSIELSNNKREVSCECNLSYFTANNTYLLESCNLIDVEQKTSIETKIDLIKNLENKELRKLIRKNGRTREHKHEKGAGLGYMLMMLKSTAPIEISFKTYNAELLKYRQKLVI